MNGARATLKSILGEDFPIADIVKQIFRGMVTAQVATKTPRHKEQL
jgi:hypothetical protein